MKTGRVVSNAITIAVNKITEASIENLNYIFDDHIPVKYIDSLIFYSQYKIDIK